MGSSDDVGSLYPTRNGQSPSIGAGKPSRRIPEPVLLETLPHELQQGRAPRRSKRGRLRRGHIVEVADPTGLMASHATNSIGWLRPDEDCLREPLERYGLQSSRRP